MNESPIFDTENWTFRQVGKRKKNGIRYWQTFIWDMNKISD